VDSIRNQPSPSAGRHLVIATLAALAVLVAVRTVRAVPPHLEYMPGFVDGSAFSEIADRAPDESRLVEVCISKPMLRVLAKSFEVKDTPTANMLRKLEAVTAVIIGLDEDQEELRAEAQQQIKDIVAELPTRNWECLAHIREKHQEVHVMVCYGRVQGEEDPAVVGLTVLMSTRGKGDIVFVNICGEIDLANMGLLGTAMSLPGLEYVPGKTDKPAQDDRDPESDEG